MTEITLTEIKLHVPLPAVQEASSATEIKEKLVNEVKNNLIDFAITIRVDLHRAQ